MPRAKRKVFPGYPKEFVFQCREEVDAYLSGDRITCLLCGMDFKALGPHIVAVHEMSDDDYRSRFGLPYKRGLQSETVRHTRSAHGKRIFEENKEEKTAALQKAQDNSRGSSKPAKPTYWKNERTKFTREHYEEFVRRIMNGGTVSEVGAQPDMPHIAHIYWYMKRDKDFAQKYRAIVPLFRPAGKRRRSAALDELGKLDGELLD